VLAKVPAADLRAYVVWLPVMPSDDLAAAARAAAAVTDPRAAQFWDGDRALGAALGRALRFPARAAGQEHGLAWDVYLLYPRGARWPPEGVPRPAFWMQQLDDVKPEIAPELDGPALRAKVEATLAGSGGAPGR
jgi:hypothetical protein